MSHLRHKSFFCPVNPWHICYPPNYHLAAVSIFRLTIAILQCLCTSNRYFIHGLDAREVSSTGKVKAVDLREKQNSKAEVTKIYRMNKSSIGEIMKKERENCAWLSHRLPNQGEGQQELAQLSTHPGSMWLPASCSSPTVYPSNRISNCKTYGHSEW